MTKAELQELAAIRLEEAEVIGRGACELSSAFWYLGQRIRKPLEWVRWPGWLDPEWPPPLN